MTSPSEDYLNRERSVHRAIGAVDLGGLEYIFESSNKNARPMELPDHVKFYEKGTVVGELHYLEEPMRMESQDNFQAYARQIMEHIGDK